MKLQKNKNTNLLGHGLAVGFYVFFVGGNLGALNVLASETEAVAVLARTDSIKKIVVQGIMSKGALNFAYVQLGRRGEWVKENGAFEGHKVLKISGDSVTLSDENGGEFTVSLALSRVVESNGDGLPSRKWIDSRDNPMLASPAALPVEIRREWKQLTPEEKNLFLEYYENHGWSIKFTDASWGGISFVWINPDSTEHQKAVAEDREFFSRSLTKDGESLWLKILQNEMPQGDPGNITPRQRVLVEQRLEDIDRLRATLPEQGRKNLDRLTMF